MRRPGVYETNETSRVALLYFRSMRLLALYRYKMQHLHKRGKINLGGEGETEVEQGAEVVLVDSIIPHVTARRLKSAKSQDDQKETSVEYAIRKVTTRKTVPCSNNSALTTLRRRIKMLLRQRK
jgi:hypothetical protein